MPEPELVAVREREAALRRDLGALERAPAEEVLRWGLERFHPRMAIVTAFQAEGMVLLDLAHRLQPDVRVVTVDTGRLPEETYELIDQVRGRYGIVVEVLVPEARQVSSMVERHGVNLFLKDPALRRLCCQIRKVFPLERALQGLDAWVTGLRRSQSDGRATTASASIDREHGDIVKLAPLAGWSVEDVWSYIRTHRVPFNPLHERGFASIGCRPCTRAVAPGEPERAGRWWWETGDDKECGIHRRSRSERFEEELAWVMS